MKEKQGIYILIASVIIGISIISTAYIFTHSDKTIEKEKQTALMDINELSEYLGIETNIIDKILRMEIRSLSSNEYTGIPLKYMSIDGKKYFSKMYVDIWLHNRIEVAEKYDTSKKTIQHHNLFTKSDDYDIFNKIIEYNKKINK
ncbi:hypothetical protein PV797_15675 [Clostridiaceae bacterium M8S5]|nr:hypothetical protein PV797_15675 [Clostridiaceae bacterium M8S5]